jgi:hypothetical protein
MTTQQAASKLRLKLHASIIPNGVIDESNPPAIYEVLDERNEVVAFITNKRASSLPPLWQVSRVEDGRQKEIVGFHDTAEAALATFQGEAK